MKTDFNDFLHHEISNQEKDYSRRSQILQSAKADLRDGFKSLYEALFNIDDGVEALKSKEMKIEGAPIQHALVCVGQEEWEEIKKSEGDGEGQYFRFYAFVMQGVMYPGAKPMVLVAHGFARIGEGDGGRMELLDLRDLKVENALDIEDSLKWVASDFAKLFAFKFLKKKF